MIKDFKELLVQKEFESWLINNHTLYEDITELAWLVDHFELMYGVKLNLTYDDSPKEEPKGRKLSIGVEKIFE